MMTEPESAFADYLTEAEGIMAKMAEMAAANLLAGLKGDPLPTCVNPEVYS